MDKRKLIKFFVLLLVIFILCGCATAKGLGEGLKGLGKGLAKTNQGIVQDSKNFWQALLKADNWIKENLW
jgi:predicted small secreted protein